MEDAMCKTEQNMQSAMRNMQNIPPVQQYSIRQYSTILKMQCAKYAKLSEICKICEVQCEMCRIYRKFNNDRYINIQQFAICKYAKWPKLDRISNF